ncbi:MAG TPA: metallophosphoesterase [Clostridiales bacterium]|nr:metallophosphoesterase [Clostridiales bacterium]
MKLIIVSDTHLRVERLIHRISEIENVDMILHLGDMVRDANTIAKRLGKKVIEVKGNCDMTGDKIPITRQLIWQNKKILMTHGHEYNVKTSLNRLFYKALESQPDIVLFGHTHMPMQETLGGILFLNPGSATYPREFRMPSFGVLDYINGEIVTDIITF